MSDCTHPRLQLLGGALHPSGKDYQCQECKEFLVAELTPQTIGVHFGSMPAAEKAPATKDKS